MAKNITPKSWASWIRASDGVLRSDDPLGLYGSYTPALPAAMSTTFSLPTGNTWTATNTSSSSIAGTGTGNRTDCSVPYALANCAGGDVIIVTKGATYTGPWNIPNKAGSSFVYVISSGDTSVGGTGLPAAGTRVAPANATNMAKVQISAAAASAAIQTATSAHHFRFVGIEATVGPTTTDFVYNTISTGNSETLDSQVANQIIFDRCYVHGGTHATLAGRRGFFLSGTNIAVIDSYVSGYYENGADSQAILVYQGNGPFKFHNNYLEGASENLLTGGSDPTIPNSVPSDITITHNTFFKPLSWIGAALSVKNLLEFKNGQRVLVEGNIFQNNWVGSDQSGFALLITPRNQSGTAPWCVTKDITIRKNKFLNVGAGFTIAGTDSGTSARTYRVLVENNLMDITDPSTGAARRGFNIFSGPQFLTIRHNTILNATNAFTYAENVGVTGGLIGTGFRCTDNIYEPSGFIGNGIAYPKNTIPQEFASYTFSGNVAISGAASEVTGLPGTYYTPANQAAVGFTNIAGAFSTNDYTLTGASPYHNAGTDGTDIGCDIAALNAAIA